MKVGFFRFEKGDRDFPFYKDNPKISQNGWFVLLGSVVISFLLYIIISNELVSSIVFPLIMLIPLLFFLRGNIKLLFTKLSSNDFALVLVLFVGYMIYALVMGEFLSYIGLVGTEVGGENQVSWFSTFTLIFSLMGEELLKLIPFLFLLKVFFNFTNKRRLSVLISMILVMVGFGLMHASDISLIPSVIIIQGFGSIFEFLAYFRSKNLLMSYLTHLITDVCIFILTMAGL